MHREMSLVAGFNDVCGIDQYIESRLEDKLGCEIQFMYNGEEWGTVR